MSGFTASNSRIKVVETVSNVDETVFDTDHDMPHIVGTTYLSGVAVDFDDLDETQNYVGQECSPTYELEWTLVYVPAVWYNFQTYTPGSWTQTFDWFYNSFSRETTYGFTTYHRETTDGFYEWSSEWVYDPCGTYVPYYEYSVDAEEYSSTTNIATLPTDEDGNNVAVDFIIIQATGTRSRNGKDPRFNQALPTTVPSKTFSFQGSVLLESSGEADGDSWFRRIMSVYTSGSNLKLKVQESVKSISRGANNSPFPHLDDTRSTYSFNLKVFFGKFRQ
jgi:hypothetical protein